jgi:hypothetical protein
MRFNFIMLLPIRPSRHGGCAMSQNTRMSHYCYLIADIGSLTFDVPIIAGPCWGIKGNPALRSATIVHRVELERKQI